MLFSFLEKGRALAFLIFFSPRRCCGFEVSQVCADITLALAGREMLISARGKEGVLPAPDPVGCLKLSVTYETSRTHRSELYFGKLKILEWVRWQTRMKNYFLILIFLDVASFIKKKKKSVISLPHPTYHILGYLVSRQIFNIFMFLVDYFWEFSSIDDFFKYPYLDSRIKSVGFLDIFANDSCYSWSPWKKKIKITNRKQTVLLWIRNTDYFKHNNS